MVDMSGNARGPMMPNGKDSYTIDEAATQITRGASGLGMTITYSFLTSFPSSVGTVSGFSQITGALHDAVKLSLSYWADVTGITFTELTGNDASNATMTFGGYSVDTDTPDSPGFASGSAVWLNVSSATSYMLSPAYLSYGAQVVSHEIGHALGLSHPSAYNYTGSNQNYTDPENAGGAKYFEDTRQFSIMSYFKESDSGNGAFFGANNYGYGPMIDDIAAIQKLYDANTSIRTGNDTYGFNVTTPMPDYYKASNGALIFSAWDGGGIDTFDFSGYSGSQMIDLREGHFSSVGGLTYNVSIAQGVSIENAVGGAGDDTIYGNSLNNVLFVSTGLDTVYGYSGEDLLDVSKLSGVNSFILGKDGSGNITLSFSGGVTTIVGVDAVQAGNNGSTFSQGNDISGVVIRGGTGADIFNVSAGMMAEGGSGEDLFKFLSLKTNSNSYVDGGANADTIDISQFSGSMTIDLGSSDMMSDSNALVSFGSIEKFVIGSTKVSIVGTSQGQTITSGHGNSTIYGGGGADHIIGLSIDPGAQANFLYGDDGDDVIEAAGASFIFGGGDNDTITGSGEADQISGGPGNDNINAGAGDDIIFGIDGVDEINGGGDFDELKELGNGLSYTFSLVGGSLWISNGANVVKLISVERVTFINPSSPADFSVLTSDVISLLESNGNSLSGYDLRSAMLAQGMDIDGASFGRIYTADATTPVIGGGNSIIDGTTIGGGVIYTSGPLTVTLKDFPEQGHIGTVVGPGINNELFNLDFVEGSGYADVFNVSGSSPFSKGLSINGKGGIDTLSFSDLGSGANLQVSMSSGSATTSSGSVHFTEFEKFIGSAGNDSFFLTGNGFSVNAGRGVDTADFSQMGGGTITDAGLFGFERFVGSSGNDVFKISKAGAYAFVGGGGYDAVSYEGMGAVTISGSVGIGGASVGDTFSGISEIRGSEGADTFSGSGIKFYGGSGNDTFIGGGGGWFDGGAGGMDVVSYANAGAVNLNAYYSGTSNNYGDYLVGVEKFIGSADNDVFADAAGVTFEGGGSADAFTLAWGGVAKGGVGNDVFYVNSSYNNVVATIDGGADHDQLIIKDGAFSAFDMQSGSYRTYDGRMGTATSIEEVCTPWGTVSGTSGSDIIKVTSYGGTYAGNGKAFGGAGNDILSSDQGSMAELHGGADSDTITSLGQDKIYGDGGVDYLYGGGKTTLIDGGADDDWIYAAPDLGRLTTVYTGGGVNHVINSGSATGVEVVYSFTKSMTDGDGGGLLSVVDQGGTFEVVTSQGTDYISGVANIFFSVANQPGWSEAFYLRPGINYHYSPGQSMMSQNEDSVSYANVEAHASSARSAEDVSLDGQLSDLVWRPEYLDDAIFDQIRMTRDDHVDFLKAFADGVGIPEDSMIPELWMASQVISHQDYFLM